MDLVVCFFVLSMACGWLSSSFTVAAYAANSFFGLVAVLPQVVINYKNKSTGQLSLLVTAMTFGGMSARLYTTFMEVDDLALQLTMSLANRIPYKHKVNLGSRLLDYSEVFKRRCFYGRRRLIGAGIRRKGHRGKRERRSTP